MKSLPTELDSKIDEISKWMFPGDQREIARRARCAESRVSETLNKRKSPSKRVLEVAIEVMNENKAKFECLERMKIA